MIRTHDAGSLRAEDIGQQVTLAGWVARRRDHGGVAFIDLREASGVVQVVVREEVAHQLRGRVLPQDRRRRCRSAPRATRTPASPPATSRSSPTTSRSSAPRRPLPFQIDDHVDVGEEARLKYRYLDLRRPGPAAAIRLRSKVNAAAREVLARQGLRRDRDADADPLDARGCARLPRAGPAAARQLVRAAAEPAAVQAAAHGRRHGAVLPDRALLSRRGLPRRPPAGVHPARHRDELRRAGRRPRAHGADARRDVGAHRLRDPDADPAHDVRRGDAPVRLRQARPALGSELVECTDYFKDTPFRVFQADVRRRGRDARRRLAAAPAVRRVAGVGQAARRRGLAYVTVGEDGELGGPVAKNLSEAERAGLAAARRREARRLRLLRAPARPRPRAACSVPRASRSARAAA